MSDHDVAIILRQMLDHAHEATQMIQGRFREDLDTDRMLNLSLVRLLEIIGEAANRVPGEVKKRYNDIPWMETISLRNRLIHGYDSIDFDILWKIVTEDLPPLVNELERIISEEG